MVLAEVELHVGFADGEARGAFEQHQPDAGEGGLGQCGAAQRERAEAVQDVAGDVVQ